MAKAVKLTAGRVSVPKRALAPPQRETPCSCSC